MIAIFITNNCGQPADGLNPLKATNRMIRWLAEPINYNPPTFANESGKKEIRVASKL